MLSRESLNDIFDQSGTRKYLSQIIISKDSPLIGKTIAESGFTRSTEFEVVQHILRESPKKDVTALFTFKDVARIFREVLSGKEESQDVNMKALLQEGDRLVILSGQRNILMTDESLDITREEMPSDDTVTMEGMIAPGSRFIGQFAETFNNTGINRAQIIAVHRLTGKINADFNMVKLSIGDTVLIKGDEADLAKLFEDGQIINLIKPVQEPYHKKRAPIAIAVLFVAVALATVDVMPIAGGALVMLTPIAIGMAQTMGVDPRPFVVAIMFGASASFATPVGYQTNTLVFHAGGYQFKDFLKVGVPMNLLMWVVASFVIPWYWEM